MEINQRRLATNLLNVVVLAGVILLVWVYLARGLTWVYLAVHAYYADGAVFSIPTFVLSLQYYSVAAGSAVYIAVVIRLLRSLRGLVGPIRRYTYPPYRTTSPKQWPPLITRLKFQTGEMHSLKMGLGILVGTLLYLVAIIRFGHIQAPLYGESVIQTVSEGQFSYLTTIFSYFSPVPLVQIEERLIDGLDQFAIASNLLFLWIPTAFLTIGVLNLISFLYNRIRRFLYAQVVH